MAGWNLTEGKLKTDKVSDDKYWALFNYVFSDSSGKESYNIANQIEKQYRRVGMYFDEILRGE